MQAASPAVEITRLLHLLGLGTDVLRAFAAVLLLYRGSGVCSWPCGSAARAPW